MYTHLRQQPARLLTFTTIVSNPCNRGRGRPTHNGGPGRSASRNPRDSAPSRIGAQRLNRQILLLAVQCGSW
jgi:hypothetical protein